MPIELLFLVTKNGFNDPSIDEITQIVNEEFSSNARIRGGDAGSEPQFSMEIAFQGELSGQINLDYYIAEAEDFEIESYPNAYAKLMSSKGYFHVTVLNIDKKTQRHVHNLLVQIESRYQLSWWIGDFVGEFPDWKSFSRQFNRFFFF